MVMKPVTAHAPNSKAGEFTSRAIAAETIKMPEPIIDPMTSVVALVKPRAATSSEVGCCVATVLSLVSAEVDIYLGFTSKCAEIPLLLFAVILQHQRSPPRHLHRLLRLICNYVGLYLLSPLGVLP